MPRFLRGPIALLAVGLLLSPAAAAPPTLTSLFPAGAQRGQTVEVAAAGSFEKWPCELWVSGKGVTAKPAKAKGHFTITVAADAELGVYQARAHDAQGASGMRSFVVGTLPEVVEKEPNDSPAQAQSVPPSAVVNAKLAKRGDVDCFAVQLKKGQTFVAAIDANRVLQSPMDAVLQIVSADGFVLKQGNDTDGLDPRVIFSVPKDGTYIARVFAFPAQPDSGIRFSGAETYLYRLTLTTGGYADYSWPLAVAAKAPRTVELVGWNLPPSARRVKVPAGGVRLATLAPPGIAEPVALPVEPHPCHLVSELAKRAAIAPFTASGRLDKHGQTDSFPLTAKKNQPLTLQVETGAVGVPLAPVLRVLDKSGKQLVRAESNGSSSSVQATFKPPADGTYRVEVRDLFGAGGARHVYRLRVLTPEPDFALTVATDRVTITPGKPTDIPVTVVRQNGFKPTVAISVEGLPAGVSAVPQPGKPDAKTITLRFTAKQPHAGAAIRIIGRADGTTHAATAPGGLRDLDVWLTVAAPAAKKK
jgi:hypothetical protein